MAISWNRSREEISWYVLASGHPSEYPRTRESKCGYVWNVCKSRACDSKDSPKCDSIKLKYSLPGLRGARSGFRLLA